jgi:Uma2 family endonuclease
MPLDHVELPTMNTVADLIAGLGDIPPKRIRMNPFPGSATKNDLLKQEAKLGVLLELIDGTLVEKPMGMPESHIALELAFFLRLYLQEHKLGFLGGADALIEFLPDQLREPDLCFISKRSTEDGHMPEEAIGTVIPELCVEVLSESNTEAEMTRKIGEYFRAGVKLVWIIDPATRTADTYGSPTKKAHVPARGTLNGSDVLPGFTLPLSKLFEQFAPTKAKKKPRKKK